jgi:hypothetical protein
LGEITVLPSSAMAVTVLMTGVMSGFGGEFN